MTPSHRNGRWLSNDTLLKGALWGELYETRTYNSGWILEGVIEHVSYHVCASKTLSTSIRMVASSTSL
jgi:hypothetical protein